MMSMYQTIFPRRSLDFKHIEDIARTIATLQNTKNIFKPTEYNQNHDRQTNKKRLNPFAAEDTKQLFTGALV